MTMKLDRIDLKILLELQKNGRITNVELADLVHLSPSPCLMRVKKLQTEGYIAGYSAQIDVSKLGQTLTVFTEITLKNHRQIDFARFLATVDKIDEVMECHLVSGGYDYLMKFVTSGIAEYQTIMERLIDLDVGIDKYFSYVVPEVPDRQNALATRQDLRSLSKVLPFLSSSRIGLQEFGILLQAVEPTRVELWHGCKQQAGIGVTGLAAHDIRA